MEYIFKKEIIDYEYINNKHKDTIVFLHGWGGNKNSFTTSKVLLKKNYNILSLTFPTIQPTEEVWDLFDYCNLVLDLLKIHNITSLILICHSFGFRVACLLKYKVKIAKIIITGGAISYNQKLRKIQQNNAKIMLKNRKFKKIYENYASIDYKQLSIINKTTFKNIVNFVTENLLQFDCPMLLFWGRKDKETKLRNTRILKRQNNVKTLIVNSGHFAYIEYSSLFNNAILEFIS